MGFDLMEQALCEEKRRRDLFCGTGMIGDEMNVAKGEFYLCLETNWPVRILGLCLPENEDQCFGDWLYSVEYLPTGEIGKLSQPGEPLYNIEHSNGGLITFPGGVPIKDNVGRIIGAIGVSGSTVEQDHAVAEAGVAAIG